jgi:hypothetical protein
MMLFGFAGLVLAGYRRAKAGPQRSRWVRWDREIAERLIKGRER